MFISYGRRFAFFHIPKTGGTALTLALEARALKDDVIVGDTPKAKLRAGRLKGVRTAGRLWKHSTLADIDGLMTGQQLEGMFLFTVVRNPWDRVVSLYHWLRAGHLAHPMAGLARSCNFTAFLNHPLVQVSLATQPACLHLTDRAGLERGHLYARLEHLADDLAPFEAHLGFRLALLARANVSDRPRDWRVFYTKADAALVGRLCARDVDRFGYRFDG